MTEYLVVGVFCLVVIVAVSLGPQPIEELIDAVKKFFSAYSYVMSVTS